MKQALWSAALLLALLHGGAAAAELDAREQLGRQLFFDTRLSANGNQSCATCHDPAVGWSGPDSAVNAQGAVYEGSVAGRFGNRRPPSAAYATPAPKLRYDARERLFVGGNFWDGRATGEKLGNPAADQALGPFLNHVEQALPDAAAVVQRVCGGPYAEAFRAVWGTNACDDVERAFGYVGLAIAAYEGSREVNCFDSKYDAYLAGKAKLSAQAQRGLRLFEGKGKCAQCHVSTPGPKGQPPLFTDLTYDNIGVPRNADNPFYYDRAANPQGAAWTDFGLGGFLKGVPGYRRHAAANLGKHKVPTLRNVAQRPSTDFVRAYGHNGYFKSLKQVVRFYNTRDVLPACGDGDAREGIDCWPLPEVAANLNTDEMGRLGLTDAEEDAIVAFLETLTDGHVAAK
jgi:cytochrome c peroxidase